MLITGKQLQTLCPNLTFERANFLAEKLEFVLPHYGLYNKECLPDFLTQLIHESGSFRLKDENLNYSARRIVEVWPSRFKSLMAAKPFEKNALALANKVYGGRMGNRLGTSDGYYFRGAGFIMLTGRDVAIRYGKYVGIDDLQYVMQLCRTDDYWALDSSAWLFAVDKKLLPYALADKIELISRRINGGAIGIADRKTIFKKASQIV